MISGYYRGVESECCGRRKTERCHLTPPPAIQARQIGDIPAISRRARDRYRGQFLLDVLPKAH